MGRNRDKKRPFGEGVSRKGQKKLKLRNEAISKAREILGATGDVPVEQEKKVTIFPVILCLPELIYKEAHANYLLDFFFVV